MWKKNSITQIKDNLDKHYGESVPSNLMVEKGITEFHCDHTSYKWNPAFRKEGQVRSDNQQIHGDSFVKCMCVIIPIYYLQRKLANITPTY